MTNFVQQIYNATAIGGVYLLVALGITLIYGLTRLVNFAQGEMLTLGAFLAYALTSAGIPFVPAVVLTVIIVGLASEVLDIVLFRPTLSQPFNGFVLSLGLIIALEAAYALVWTNATHSIPAPVSGNWEILGVHVDAPRLLIIGVTIAAATVLLLGLERTQTGRAMRAVAENGVAARVLGIPVGRLTSLTFIVGSSLAALAGCLMATVYPFTASFGSRFLLAGFAVAIIGGLGNVRGAIVAAGIISLSETLGGAYVSLAWSSAFSLGAMILMIVVRPQGLFRGTESGGSLNAADAAVALGPPYRPPHPRTGGLSGWRRGGAVLTHRWTGLAVLGIIGALVPWILPTARLLSDASYAVVLAIAVYSAWMLFRYAGIFSIGQAGFMGIGAYASAIASEHWSIGFWPQVLFAIVVSATVAAIVGWIALRTSGSYFMMLMFAMSALLVTVLSNWISLTEGPVGLVQSTAPRPLGGLVDIGDTESLYLMFYVFLVAAIGLVAWVGRTRFGRRLVMVRDNETLAQAAGLNTLTHKVAAFAWAGALAGVAGVLYVYQQQVIQPQLFGPFPGIEICLMMILGGAGVLLGPMVGAVIIVLLPDVVGLGPNVTQLVEGLLLVAVIRFMPKGFVGSLSWDRRPDWLRLAGGVSRPAAAVGEGSAHADA